MSPLTTCQSCGTSSSLNLASQTPMRVKRSSSSVVIALPLAPLCILRNLSIASLRPLKPARSQRKKAPPGESSTISRLASAISGTSTSSSPPATQTSSARFAARSARRSRRAGSGVPRTGRARTSAEEAVETGRLGLPGGTAFDSLCRRVQFESRSRSTEKANRLISPPRRRSTMEARRMPPTPTRNTDSPEAASGLFQARLPWPSYLRSFHFATSAAADSAAAPSRVSVYRFLRLKPPIG